MRDSALPLSTALAALLVAALVLFAGRAAAQTSPLPGHPSRTGSLANDPAAFSATEGASGTGNALVFDELVPLGSATVGQGPNAGTLVRITNTGGRSMALGAPELAGTNENDFAVEIESSTLFALTASAPPAFGAPAPFRRLAAANGAPGPGIVLRIQLDRLASLGTLREVVLHDFPLPDLGAVTLDLRRRESPVRPDARLVVDGREVAGGLQALARELQVWSGEVAGMPGSRAFLVLSPSSAWGYVELPFEHDRRIHLLAERPGSIRLVRDGELRALGLGTPATPCLGPARAPGRVASPAAASAPLLLSIPTVATCRLAIETDWQLYQKFNSSAQLSSYVIGLVAAASERYFTDVQTTLSLAYLGIHTNSNDGWTTQDIGGGGDELLEEFRVAWSPGWPAEADLAHFLSGANLGPIAHFDVLCDQTWGFGLTDGVVGNIDWSTWTGAPGNFVGDFLIFAHELGHNFGAGHTHETCPPLDRCWTNCAGPNVCTRGTLMSYCYACGLGVGNVDLRFHPVHADAMRARVNASCLGDALLAPGDFVQYRVRFNPLFTTGAKSATLRFPHGAPNATQPFRVRLSGTAN